MSKRDEAKTLLIHYLELATETALDRQEVGTIVDLIADAAIEELRHSMRVEAAVALCIPTDPHIFRQS